MLKQTTFAIVLLALVGFECANALTCYACNSTVECVDPITHVCSDETANSTSAALREWHKDVKEVETSNNKFECADLGYYNKTDGVYKVKVLGCVHPDIEVCNLSLIEPNEAWTSSCRRCTTNYCNPAGTHSGSFYTMLGSALALLLAKVIR